MRTKVMFCKEIPVRLHGHQGSHVVSIGVDLFCACLLDVRLQGLILGDTLHFGLQLGVLLGGLRALFFPMWDRPRRAGRMLSTGAGTAASCIA